jgi:hypothetical protein
MDEYILAVGLFNEAITLGVIEPLHLAFGHRSCLLHRNSSGEYYRG